MNSLPFPRFDEEKGIPVCELAENINIFFAEMEMPHTDEGKILTEQAKSLCAECPFKIECGAYAIDHPDERGVWGGLSEDDRRQIRRKMKARSLA